MEIKHPKRLATGLLALGVAMSGCGANPDTATSTPSATAAVPTPINSENPTISTSPTLPASPESSPTKGPEVSASAETQAELDKAVKD